MGLFSRNAAWLKNYFTPSVSSAAQQPSAVSDDVQLVHPYSSGWEQAALNYFFQANLLNPGQDANLFCILPPGDPDPGDPENEVVWRVILANISIPAGPAANFDMRMFIGDNGAVGDRIVDYETADTIPAGSGTRRMLYPTSEIETIWPAVLTRSGLRFTGLGITQTSAQAANLEGIVIDAWILRSPRGGSIGWP